METYKPPSCYIKNNIEIHPISILKYLETNNILHHAQHGSVAENPP